MALTNKNIPGPPRLSFNIHNIHNKEVALGL